MASGIAVIGALKSAIDIKCTKRQYQLPSTGNTFAIEDFRPSCYNDEQFYKSKSFNRLAMRRGVAAVYSGENSENAMLHVLCGAPKFGYINDAFTPTFEGRRKLMSSQFTCKENGEAGHLSFFPYDAHWFAIVGSKCVHVVVCVDSITDAMKDIMYYRALKEDRLATVLDNCALLMQFAQKPMFDRDVQKQVYDNAWTIVFEAINDNHIVDYGKKGVFAIMLTYPTMTIEEGMCVVPNVSYPLMRSWGFRTARLDVVDASHIERCWGIHRMYETLDNCEGCVVVEVYEGAEVTEPIVGKMYKHKNIEYVLKRMARELIKRGATSNDWNVRLRSLHIERNDEEDKMIDRLLAFHVWLVKSKRDLNNIQETFKGLLAEFDAAYNDQKTINMLKAEAPVVLRPVPTPISHNKATTSSQAIVLVGLQGSGKTTLRNALMHVLGKRASYVNQDELGSDRRRFISALKNPKTEIVVVDKCNHLERLRTDVFNVYSDALVVEFDMDVALSIERIRNRGINHLSLHGTPTSGFEQVVANCAKAFEPLTEHEKAQCTHIRLDPSDTVIENLRKVLVHVKSCGAGEGEAPPFVAVDEEQLITHLQVCDEDVKKKALAKIVYWRATVNPSTVLAKISAAKFKFPESIQLKTDEFHLTLMYCMKVAEAQDHEILTEYVDMIGKEITLNVSGIVFDDKCAALRIAGPVPLCNNQHPHITLGCAKGVAPVYANTMLDMDGGEGATGMKEVKNVACEFEMTGVVNYVMAR
jgi:tRNA uridine 5-carbamoylmethylation protein Kti12